PRRAGRSVAVAARDRPDRREPHHAAGLAAAGRGHQADLGLGWLRRARAPVKLAIFTAVALVLATARGFAYPQFSLGRDQATCTGCHISPAGGGLLNENGRSMIETFSTYGGNPDPAHGRLDGPDWLLVGADLRAGAGLIYDEKASPNAFP